MSEQELAHEVEEVEETSEQANADDAQVESVSDVEELEASDEDAPADSAEAPADSTEGAEEAGDSVETVEESEEASSEPAGDPLEEFKSKLRRQEGEWFVIHTYAGYENRVKTNLESRSQTMNMEDDIFEIQVPMEEVMEIKNTTKKLVRRVRIPGYVLVRMNLTDESWGVVRHTPGVTGFVGQDAYNPVPLRLNEVVDMLAPVFEAEQVEAGEATPAAPQIETGFEIGEAVTVKDGPFEGMPASIAEIKPESSSLVVLISVFERETPVTLQFNQVSKV
ncbi:transcription antitermination protein NusG [Mycobacteroides abscessus subsp. abscessus]|nr:transcription antitermination protein NusG [Mycobacteroides abscessus subsp. abscessus]